MIYLLMQVSRALPEAEGHKVPQDHLGSLDQKEIKEKLASEGLLGLKDWMELLAQREKTVSQVFQDLKANLDYQGFKDNQDKRENLDVQVRSPYGKIGNKTRLQDDFPNGYIARKHYSTLNVRKGSCHNGHIVLERFSVSS